MDGILTSHVSDSLHLLTGRQARPSIGAAIHNDPVRIISVAPRSASTHCLEVNCATPFDAIFTRSRVSLTSPSEGIRLFRRSRTVTIAL